MNVLIEKSVQCPCCGESIELLIDLSVDQQSYTEDCQVCCRPIIVNVEVDSTGGVEIIATSENE
ncbi:MAG: CPXCG motif-containing cysteine-rich protein [Proteobacteria bacterium]|nr:CPXCG motif-containing cysteine-rich protein [Pseudomonadota bacterium]